VADAEKAFRIAAKTKNINVIDDLGFLGSKLLDDLDSLNIREEITSFIDGSRPLDDIIDDVNDFVDNQVFDYADEFANELHGLHANEEAIAEIATIEQYHKVTPELRQRIYAMQSYNNRAEKQSLMAMQEINALDTKKVDAILNEYPHLQEFFDESFLVKRRADSRNWIDTAARKLKDAKRHGMRGSAKEFWQSELGFKTAELPEHIKDIQGVADYFWDDYLVINRRRTWANTRDLQMEAAKEFLGHAGFDSTTASPHWANANETWKVAKSMDEFIPGLEKAPEINIDEVQSLLDAAKEAGNEKAIAHFESILEEAGEAGAVGKVADAPQIFPVREGNVAPTSAEGYHNSRKHIDELRQRIIRGVKENYGKTNDILLDEAQELAVTEYFKTASKQYNEMLFVMDKMGTEGRDFGLLDYANRRNFDLATGLIFPYQFWYGRTYKNWMERLIKNPSILASYGRYRGALEKIHAGAPDWWKYNINTNELLGLDKENPFFFNLEATINPINGLTGVDFEDKYKVTGWFTNLLQDMNRFGPSTHTLISFATALALFNQGEDEAAARWGSRLFPQTQTLMSIDSLIGDDPVKDYDPFVQFFSEGIDPYTRSRVGRAFSQMILDGTITQEQAIDAARTQEGEIWDDAMQRAVAQRAPGQLSSFLFGTGFKARNTGDILTDKMYGELYKVMGNWDNLTGEERRNSFDAMRQKYPFMDPVLISRKGGIERDIAYAYNVLGRIPPGYSTEIYEMAGMDKRLASKFYGEGDMDEWKEGDRLRFMGSVVDMAAVLAIPERATQQEWSAAKNQYSELNTLMTEMFGEGIKDKEDTYFGLFGITKEKAYAYLEANPDLEAARDFKAGVIASRPESLLATYYGGIDQIEKYYRGLMWDDIEKTFGPDIWNTYPRPKAYWRMKNSYEATINKHVIDLGLRLRDGLPAEVRPDYDLSSIGAQDILRGLEAPQDPMQNMTPDQWIAAVGNTTFKYAMRGAQGQTLSYTARKRLEETGEELGIDGNRLIQLIGLSIARMQGQ
jgi:hypothetical protein